jgi:hypothetical protein
MRTLITILTLTLLTLGCSNKDNSKGSNNDILQTTYTDTTERNNNVLNENIQYIGFIEKFYFSNDNEAYVELYFIKNETKTDEYTKIVKLADSLIYEDDENSRHKFPDNLSQQYFDLRGLSKLKIYDKNNKLFCNADFIRVEYLSQNISSPFIAVYKIEKKLESDIYYCISNFNEKLENMDYSITNDTLITKNVLTKLNVVRPYDGLENNGTHIQYKTSDTTLSIVNSDTCSFILLSTKSEFKVLYKSSEAENILNAITIPILENHLPYILTRKAMPESDVMWDDLLYFDGTTYKSTNRQRKK